MSILDAVFLYFRITSKEGKTFYQMVPVELDQYAIKARTFKKVEAKWNEALAGCKVELISYDKYQEGFNDPNLMDREGDEE